MRAGADRLLRRRPAPRFLWGGVVVVILAWALRLYRLDAQSLWYDEGYCALVATFTPPEIVRWTAREFTPPLYHLLLALWLPVAGTTEFAARFLSVWTGTLLVAGMVRLGCALHSRTAGLMAGLLLACSPFFVWYSQETRMYALQALLGVLATWCLIEALRRPDQWRRWAALGLLDGLALYAQTTGGFLLVFHGLAVLAGAVVSSLIPPACAALSSLSPPHGGGGRCTVGRKGGRILWWGGIALGGAVVAWLPWLAYAFPHLGRNAGYWGGMLHWQQVFEGAFRGFVTGGMMDGSLETRTLVIWSGACVVGFIVLLVASGLNGWKRLLFLVAYFVVPAATMAVLFRGVPKFSPRYLIVAAPPVFLLPALGAAALWRCPDARRALGGLLLVTLLATASVGLGNMYCDPAYARSDFRAAARLVREKMAPDELVLIVPGHTFPVWQFYFGSEGWRALPDDPILDVQHVLHYEDIVGPLNRWLDGRSGVWLVGWDRRVVDPTDVVGYGLGRAGEQTWDVNLTGGVRLRHYRFDDFSPLPPEPEVMPVISKGMRDLPLVLLGCRWPQSLPADRELEAVCFWEVAPPLIPPAQRGPPLRGGEGAYEGKEGLPLHLDVSARLYDEAGFEWGRADTAISGPDLVAGRWPVGKAVLGRYQVAPFPGTPPGDFYRLELWVYEPGGASYGAASVGPVNIAPPTRPFTFTGPSDALPGGRVVNARLGDLVPEVIKVQPTQALPGEAVRVEAIWRVDGPFEAPHLTWADSGECFSLLPEPGAIGLWTAGDRYRTITPAPISKYAMGGEIDLLAVSGSSTVTVGTVSIDVTRAFTVPAGVRPMAYRLGDALSLVGADLAVQPSGDVFDLTLYWRPEEAIEQSYTVFVHLVGPDGVVYDQVDAPPRDGRHPTDHWLPGEVVADAYHLARPAGSPVGVYRVLTGMYDPVTLERLAVTDARGPIPDNAIEISE